MGAWATMRRQMTPFRRRCCYIDDCRLAPVTDIRDNVADIIESITRRRRRSTICVYVCMYISAAIFAPLTLALRLAARLARVASSRGIPAASIQRSRPTISLPYSAAARSIPNFEYSSFNPKYDKITSLSSVS